MRFEQTLARDSTLLTEGSVYELLRRDPRISFDPEIAHGGLVYDELHRELLAGVHREYIRIGRDAGLPVVAFADTWRASAARIARSRFRGRDVNGDNVRFLRDLASREGGDAFVAAYTGPDGDAYRPDLSPGRDRAVELHAPQIDALSAAGVDLIVAATLPAFEEARGIAALLSRSSVPWMLSFVVRRSGTLLDGTPLSEAIERIDDEVERAPLGYGVNCVHPDVFSEAVQRTGRVSERIVALQANASARSPEELDGSEEVEGDTPAEWAAAMQRARRVTALPMVGGCCGTSPDHMKALVSLLTANAEHP